MNVAVLLPVLGRPHRVKPVARSVEATTPDAHILFLCSPDDEQTIEQVDRGGWERLLVAGPDPGDYARKINTGYRATTEPLLFLGADDLLFHPGWLDAATSKLAPGIGVVGTNDLGSPRVMAGEHATHTLVTRDYADRYGTIDQPGAILHEGYEHEFVDDELVATAKRRDAWAFAAHSLVEHLHPNWGKAPPDALYGRQRERMRTGRKLYLEREHLWT